MGVGEGGHPVEIKLVEPVYVGPGRQGEPGIHAGIGRHHELVASVDGTLHELGQLLDEPGAPVGSVVVDPYPTMLQVVRQDLVGDTSL